MADEYADLTLLKLALAFPVADVTRDDLLNAALSAASRSIDDHCGRRFYLDGSATPRSYRPGDRIADCQFLTDDMGAAPTKVETGNDSDGWEDITADVEFAPENAVARGEAITGLINDDGWALGYRDRVRVTARWGFPRVPDQIVQATLILAARLYRRKDTPEGVLGSAEWGTVRLSRTDPDVAELISRYVLPGFA